VNLFKGLVFKRFLPVLIFLDSIPVTPRRIYSRVGFPEAFQTQNNPTISLTPTGRCREIEPQVRKVDRNHCTSTCTGKCMHLFTVVSQLLILRRCMARGSTIWFYITVSRIPVSSILSFGTSSIIDTGTSTAYSFDHIQRSRNKFYNRFVHNMSRQEKQHQQEPSESSSEGVLTIEQLRLKRMIAFGIQNAVNLHPSNQPSTGTNTAASTLVSLVPSESEQPIIAANTSTNTASSQHKTTMMKSPPQASLSQRWLSTRNKDTAKPTPTPPQYGVTIATTSSTTNQVVIDLQESSSDEENDVNHHSKHNRYNIEEEDDDFMEGRKHKGRTATMASTRKRAPPPERPSKRHMKDTNDTPINEAHPSQTNHNRHPTTVATNNNITTASMATTTYRPKYDIPSFQLATWNVWFGPWGDGSPHADVRMKAIVRLLLSKSQQHQQLSQQSSTTWNPLYCIGFQEVVPETKKSLKLALQHHRYTWYEPQQQRATYYCAIAVHSDIHVLEQGWVPFQQSGMSRGFMYVRATLPVRNPDNNPTNIITNTQTKMSPQFIFTTTHLESYCGPDYNGSDQRPLQIQEMSTFLHAQMTQHPAVRMSIISGDLNWDDEAASNRRTCQDRVLLSLIPPHWKDTWLEARSGASTDEATKTAAISKLNSKANTGSAILPTVTYKPKKSKTMTLKDRVEGFTYDAKLNPMLTGSLRRRFDRILVFDSHNNNQGPSISTSTGSSPNDDNSSGPLNESSSQQIQFINPQLLGTVAISEDLTWEKFNTHTATTRIIPTAPSDHFGYMVTVALDE
jgi:hypothetical protein